MKSEKVIKSWIRIIKKEMVNFTGQTLACARTKIATLEAVLELPEKDRL